MASAAATASAALPIARRLRSGHEEKIPAPDLNKGDLVVCEVGDMIPADGDVVEGIASVKNLGRRVAEIALRLRVSGQGAS